MGCDIHLYVESKPKNCDTWFTTGFGGEFSERNYTMFGKLAGVRDEPDYETFIEPRGVPKDISWCALDGYTLHVVENDKYEEDSYYQDAEGYCKRSDAEMWVKNGYSKYWNDDKLLVSGPDWHSASWLTFEEYEKIINTLNSDALGYNRQYPDYVALLEYMRVFHNCGQDVRIVFWFDN